MSLLELKLTSLYLDPCLCVSYLIVFMNFKFFNIDGHYDYAPKILNIL